MWFYHRCEWTKCLSDCFFWLSFATHPHENVKRLRYDQDQIAASLWWLKVIKNHLIIRVWCRSCGALPHLYSRALMIASLASMLICTSALAASSEVPTSADWAFSRLALAACKCKQRGIGENPNCQRSNRTGILSSYSKRMRGCALKIEPLLLGKETSAESRHCLSAVKASFVTEVIRKKKCQT